MEFLAEYGMFLAKAVTIVLAILVIVGSVAAAAPRSKSKSPGHIEVRHINQEIKSMTDSLKSVAVDKEVLKLEEKQAKKDEKQHHKERVKAEKEGGHQRRVYVLDFDGDIKASAVDNLREEITTILSLARPDDEIVIKLSSAGGMVHSYGLAASQIKRITDKKIPLTACVDKVAASGGYMMACVADKIVAAPFAILGSIGVVAQIPNFHKVLKKHDVDYEMITAGEYKRTLTIFGENTEKGREKFTQDIEDTHALFKTFVEENRPQVNIEEVATGEVWFGTRALERNLADELGTSDAYITDACENADVYEVMFVHKKSIQDRLSLAVHATLDKLLLTWWTRLTQFKYHS